MKRYSIREIHYSDPDRPTGIDVYETADGQFVEWRDVEPLLRERERYENAQCVTCGKDLDAPIVETYDGSINVGDHFLWNPGLNHTHIVVTKIVEHPSWSERKIWTRYNDNRIITYPDVRETWNDESRIREACRPCDDQGKLIKISD